MNDVTLTKIKLKFSSNFKIEDECWTWSGAFDKTHNPIIRFINEENKFQEISAKRFSLINSNIILESSRIYVLNSCDNDLCVNPAHLYQANAENRFWKSVNKTTNCWLWTASLDKYGYGKFSNIKNIRAHRFSYQIHFGIIPDNLCVCHKCDNPSCVNPQHLYLGTHLDNAFDRSDRKRTNVPKGTSHPFSKLTEQDVIAIRSMYATRKFSCLDLSKLFNVSNSSIRRVIRHETYK